MVEGLRAGGGPDPDPGLFQLQHEAYLRALEDAGLTLTVLPPLDSHPDSVFVEDTALCFPGFAVVLRPGAPSRQGEEDSIADELIDHFDAVIRLDAGHVDGGDVLWTGREVIIGCSSRTDETGATALARILEMHGLAARIADTPAGVLHFKSDSSALGDDVILSTSRLAQSGVFDGYELIIVPDGEEAAANCIRVNDTVLLPAGFQQTASLLREHGYTVHEVDNSEPGRIDGGLSCMSLRIPATT